MRDSLQTGRGARSKGFQTPYPLCIDNAGVTSAGVPISGPSSWEHPQLLLLLLLTKVCTRNCSLPLAFGTWRTKVRSRGERKFEEIGEALGIEAATAQALYARGMRKLRSRSRTPLFESLMAWSRAKKRSRPKDRCRPLHGRMPSGLHLDSGDAGMVNITKE